MVFDSTVEQILKDEPFRGLLGQKDEFEMLNTIYFLRLHTILHDAFGKAYTKLPNCLKKVTFFFFCQIV